MNTNFTELSMNEIEAIEGGRWYVRVAGAALFVAGVVSTFYGNPMGPDAAALGA
ncbi:hypothetical protein SAMN04487832_1021, partial [Ruminococcus sp. XPD3002]